MKKLSSFGIIISLSIFILIGCQANKENMYVLDYPITQIEISESDGYGKISDNTVTTVTDKEKLSRFEEIMRSATKKDKDVSNKKPDFDIVIIFEAGQSRETQTIQLILGNEGEESLFVKHQNESYVVSPEYTKLLRKIITNGE